MSRFQAAAEQVSDGAFTLAALEITSLADVNEAIRAYAEVLSSLGWMGMRMTAKLEEADILHSRVTGRIFTVASQVDAIARNAEDLLVFDIMNRMR